ncbi:uncharacterized protein ARMOST_06007 [Armillaria ostoyae]|uniref:Uncharacterized protein n=1 Tax=Armillaria ostoyae TaxID=47428 RepID=A0A284R1S2_ARMOS|nr:uncharacterized protein ARMOST_06007 [Armillaria ostoyae]
MTRSLIPDLRNAVHLVESVHVSSHTVIPDLVRRRVGPNTYPDAFRLLDNDPCRYVQSPIVGTFTFRPDRKARAARIVLPYV